jgi:hypothetical protein
MPNAHTLLVKIQALPIDRIAEIEDFVEFIATRGQPPALINAAVFGEAPPSHDSIKNFEEAYALVGRITSLWSFLEFVIDKCIWEIAGLDEKTGACITAQIQSAQIKLQALVSLVNLEFGAGNLLTFIRKLVDKMPKAVEKRNRAVHSPLVEDSAGDIGRINITARHRLSYGITPFTKTDFVLIVREIEELIKDAQLIEPMVEESRTASRNHITALRSREPKQPQQ